MLEQVKVEKAKLLETLQANRDKHVEAYNSAVANYRAEAVQALLRRVDELQGFKTLKLHFNLPEPRSFEEDYDRAIAMVEWSTEDEIILSEYDFRAFVLDQWNWREQFTTSTMHYNR